MTSSKPRNMTHIIESFIVVKEFFYLGNKKPSNLETLNVFSKRKERGGGEKKHVSLQHWNWIVKSPKGIERKAFEIWHHQSMTNGLKKEGIIILEIIGEGKKLWSAQTLM